jgi:hypothetical protein
MQQGEMKVNTGGAIRTLLREGRFYTPIKGSTTDIAGAIIEAERAAGDPRVLGRLIAAGSDGPGS